MGEEAVELVWPPVCHLDVVAGTIWRLRRETRTNMTLSCAMSNTATGVRMGHGRGTSKPSSGYRQLFYGETDPDGRWTVRWIRNRKDYETIRNTPQRCKVCQAIILPFHPSHPTDRCPLLSRKTTPRATTLARLMRQPGDGSCFFHSVGHHLGVDAATLRREMVMWMRDHLNEHINGTPLATWLSWESTDAQTYLDRMGHDWGGATEMAVLTRMHPTLSFHVFRHVRGNEFSKLTQLGEGDKEVWLLWSGSHYDALEPLSRNETLEADRVDGKSGAENRPPESRGPGWRASSPRTRSRADRAAQR